MTQEPDLRPATADDVKDALAFALRFEGRKRTHDADEAMSHITAARLVRHLEQCGFVLMKRSRMGDLSAVQSGHRQP